MEAICRACEAEGWNAEIVAVLSNRPQAGGLAWAGERGIATEALDHRVFESREAFDEALAERIDGHRPDLVVLAGFMRILTPAFVARYAGRMLNIHPSLLPSFGGLHTHERAIEAGCKLAGATVHFVTADLDHGPIVMQAAVPVQHDDDAQRLATRVLAAEHIIYPRSVRWFVQGELVWRDGRIHHRDGEPQWLQA